MDSGYSVLVTLLRCGVGGERAGVGELIVLFVWLCN
jgi:hypothetical protein